MFSLKNLARKGLKLTPYIIANEPCPLADFAGVTILVPCHVIKSLQLMMIGHQDNSSSNGHQGDIPYWNQPNFDLLYIVSLIMQDILANP